LYSRVKSGSRAGSHSRGARGRDGDGLPARGITPLRAGTGFHRARRRARSSNPSFPPASSIPRREGESRGTGTQPPGVSQAAAPRWALPAARGACLPTGVGSPHGRARRTQGWSWSRVLWTTQRAVPRRHAARPRPHPCTCRPPGGSLDTGDRTGR
jgi:hypothetical protein